MLGRPFAIADRDISVALPLELHDEDLASLESTFARLDDVTMPVANLPNDMSVFRHCVRLRRISSKMRPLFTRAEGPGPESNSLRSPFSAFGNIYVALDELLRELDQWRHTCPNFEHPKSLYETAGWYDLLHARERLLFVRKAVDMFSKRHGSPPKNVSILCIQAAMGTITAYAALFEQNSITYTRSYFQTLFLAGLSILFCTSMVSELDHSFLREAFDVLRVCGRTLKALARGMPDAGNFVLVFEALLVHRKPKAKTTTRTANEAGPNRQKRPRLTPANEGQVYSMAMASPDDLHSQSMDQSAVVGQHFDQMYVPYDEPSNNHHLRHNSFLSASDLDLTSPNLFDDGSLSSIFFQDKGLWTMEAGLNEYVYGDSSGDFANLMTFDFIG